MQQFTKYLDLLLDFSILGVQEDALVCLDTSVQVFYRAKKIMNFFFQQNLLKL